MPESSLLKAQVARDLLKKDFLDRLDGLDASVRRLQIGTVESRAAASSIFPGVASVGGQPKIVADGAGNVYLGSNAGQADGTHFSVFAKDGTYNGEAVGAGDLLIGDNSASKANILWDKSAGQLKIRGGSTTEVYIDTDGSLVAGGDAVGLNADGLSLSYNTDALPPTHPQTALKWGTATSDFGRIMLTYADLAGDDYRMTQQLLVSTSDSSWSTPIGIEIEHHYSTGDSITIDAPTVDVTGDLNIGGSIISSTPIWGNWRRTTDTAIGSGATYYVSWESETADTDGMWSSGTNITVQTAGVYLIMGEFQWANAADTTSRQAMLYHNGSSVGQARASAINGVATIQTVHAIVNASVNDYFRLAGRHLRGSNLNVMDARIWVYKVV